MRRNLWVERRSRLVCAHAAWLGCVVLSASSSARAQSAATMGDERHELIEQAVHARASGSHAAALELANRASGLGMTPSLRRFIAEEQMALGMLRPALVSAEACAREAEQSALPNSDVHRRACEALANSLRPQVERTPAQENPPVQVTTVRPTAVRPRAAVRQPDPAAIHARTEPRVNIGAWVLVGAGGAAVATSAVTFGLRSAALSSAAQNCGGTTLDACGQPGLPTDAYQRAVDDRNRAVTFTTASVALLSAGGVALAGGLLWLALAPREHRPAPPLVAFVPSRDGFSISLGGAL
jgi:hypothetical protein